MLCRHILHHRVVPSLQAHAQRTPLPIIMIIPMRASPQARVEVRLRLGLGRSRESVPGHRAERTVIILVDTIASVSALRT
jgi:hypothetical protein